MLFAIFSNPTSHPPIFWAYCGLRYNFDSISVLMTVLNGMNIQPCTEIVMEIYTVCNL